MNYEVKRERYKTFWFKYWDFKIGIAFSVGVGLDYSLGCQKKYRFFYLYSITKALSRQAIAELRFALD